MGITLIQLLDGLFSNLILILTLCIIDILENNKKMFHLISQLPPIPNNILITIEIACFIWKIYMVHCVFSSVSKPEEKNE